MLATSVPLLIGADIGPSYSIETDKTTAEIEAPCDGVLVKIHAKVGDDVSVGDDICSIIEN